MMRGQTQVQNYSAPSGGLRESSYRRPFDSARTDRVMYGAAGDAAVIDTHRPPFPGERRRRDLPDNDSLLKNVMDRVLAALALLILSPMLAMVAALIYTRDPGPVLFAHERIGKHGRRFKCLKFRTMVADGDAVLARHLRHDSDAAAEWRETRKLQDDPRVTPLGDLLRRSSIDELPQLFNILWGQMSVVGPRPIIDSEVGYYGDAIYDYLSVRPGLTGLWQVSGRSDVGYAQRVALDSDYVNNRSTLGDWRIIMRTVRVVALREGSY
jgi:exopolysaccharide production protein ExoY